ncbi:hypothetical protein [Kordiimonas marina]|uniref:hypothetical protein n=1 Tax=Kordiimonas marina TaxID=2872312 RepID=UPI001FF17F26|nr:hypothetical protein [Kordiimonas marina]MCJ9429942.1 hypothetical protein [Kordiimonas marina]
MTDLDCMLDRIAGLGLPCPPETVAGTISILQQATEAGFEYDDRFLERLAANHQQLGKVIAPITPGSLRGHHYEEKKKVIIWAMWGATLVFLLGFLSLSTFTEISKDYIDKTFMDRDGTIQLIVASFYLSAAGIGACFYNLVKMYKYLITNKFDVAYGSSYAMRILLGVVAGYVLAEIIPINTHNFSKPLLAMLGGFSADAVEVILTRFVDTMKTLVRGDRDRTPHTET